MTSSRKLSFAIGAFISGALLLAFIAMLFFSGGRLFAQKDRVVMYFAGSVQGLQVGAPVKLKGVVIGEIVDIQISFQDSAPAAASVFTTVTADLVLNRISAQGQAAGTQFLTDAIDNGLRAQLNFQSLLTGLLYVELDFHPDVPAEFKQVNGDLIELPTMATNFEQLSAKFQNINLESLVSNINNLALHLSELVSSGKIEQAFVRADSSLAAVEKAANRLDKEIQTASREIADSLKETRTLIRHLDAQVPVISKDLTDSLQKLDRSLASFQRAAQNIDHAVSEDSRVINQLDTSLQDVSRAARALQSLAEGLDQQPDALWRGRNHEED